MGELLDKITILAIKVDTLRRTGESAAPATNAGHELYLLVDLATASSISLSGPAFRELRRINEELWALEDYVRRTPLKSELAETARAIARLNDRRAAIKRQINEQYGSEIVEEKVYASGASAPDGERVTS